MTLFSKAKYCTGTKKYGESFPSILCSSSQNDFAIFLWTQGKCSMSEGWAPPWTNKFIKHTPILDLSLFKSQDRRLSLPVSVFLWGTDPIKRSPKITLDVESKFWKFPCWKWGTWPFNSHEWPRQNFSLQYQHNINQISEKNKEKYQFGDN